MGAAEFVHLAGWRDDIGATDFQGVGGWGTATAFFTELANAEMERPGLAKLLGEAMPWSLTVELPAQHQLEQAAVTEAERVLTAARYRQLHEDDDP
jgi:hypothetical protein